MLRRLCITINFRAMFKKNEQSVKIGDKVLVVIDKEAKELEIVGLPSGDPSHGKVSFLSPIAKALLGKKPPQTITVQLPNGNTMDCRLMELLH